MAVFPPFCFKFETRDFMNEQTIIIRLGLALLLSGLIGMERENKNRPAGFRTHILVCMGSALTMMIPYFIASSTGNTTFDPTRLGAQVISGIGFLGAGTIIREGATVKGLTTAASLWAVACVGLAVGTGFYSGAIIATVMIYLALMLLGRFGRLVGTSHHLLLEVSIDNTPGKVGEIGMMLGKYHVNIRNIEFMRSEEDEEDEAHIKFTLHLPHGLKQEELIESIASIDGVKSLETF